MTLKELRALWAIRDACYARRKLPLSDAEGAVVRAWREAEARRVSGEPYDGYAAVIDTWTWRPPR